MMQLPLVFVKVSLRDQVTIPWQIVYEWGFIHIMTTDICLWIQMAFGEAISLMLETITNDGKPDSKHLSFYNATFYRYDETVGDYQPKESFIVPPFTNACQAKETWLSVAKTENYIHYNNAVVQFFLLFSQS